MLFSVLACVAESKQGELTANCVPITTNLQGEIDPTWGADVEPGQAYQLEIEAEQYPLSQLTATVYSIGEDARTSIAETRGTETDTEEQLALPFTGPDSGRILIKLIARIGADGEDLGEFSIRLCED
jgi:hypothetical protein